MKQNLILDRKTVINWNLDLMMYDEDYMDEVRQYYSLQEEDLLDEDDYEWSDFR
jgi:hypothetical protein